VTTKTVQLTLLSSPSSQIAPEQEHSHFQVRRTRRPQALSVANAQAQSFFANTSNAGTPDVRGTSLRLLRLQQNIDPVILATQACISLRQLDQLETGEISLFYCQSLRNQAGRRVATLLNSHWDQLTTTTAAEIMRDGFNSTSNTAAETQQTQAPLSQRAQHMHTTQKRTTTVEEQPPNSPLTPDPHSNTSPESQRSWLANIFWTQPARLLCAIAGLSFGLIASLYWHLLL
jgi:hypothetical protein